MQSRFIKEVSRLVISSLSLPGFCPHAAPALQLALYGRAAGVSILSSGTRKGTLPQQNWPDSDYIPIVQIDSKSFGLTLCINAYFPTGQNPNMSFFFASCSELNKYYQLKQGGFWVKMIWGPFYLFLFVIK